MAHVIQLRQNSQAGVHPPLNAVLRASLLGLIEGAGGDLAGDTLLPANFVQVVDGCEIVISRCSLELNAISGMPY